MFGFIRVISVIRGEPFGLGEVSPPINSEGFRESTINSVKERGSHGALRSHQSTPNPFGVNSVPC